MRRAALIVAGALLASPPVAQATTLEDAIAAARAYNPQLRAAKAQGEAADARLDAAGGARLPTLSLTGEALTGRNDLGGFFGFGSANVDPRAVRLELSQPLFAGGALSAGVAQAKAGRDAAQAQLVQADDDLQVAVAAAYAGVRSAEAYVAASQAQAQTFAEWARQSDLRFKAGEIPRSDLELAIARAAEARAGAARAQGALAEVRARYEALVGAPASDLQPVADEAWSLTLDEALGQADANSAILAAAEASVRAAEAGEKMAAAQGLPSLALTARTEQVRDQFFPGYRSDAVTIGVQGRWTLFAGGRVQAAKAEASAGLRAAQANRDAARAALKTSVISAWSDLNTSRLAAVAAGDQVKAANTAVESLRNEVRVGQRPMVDLLDAQRDQLTAVAGLLAAEMQVTVADRRLTVLTRRK